MKTFEPPRHQGHQVNTKKTLIKNSGYWWIGWLIDLPGVNAQEKTREELLESLKIGAEDLLSTAVPFEAEAQMTTIDIPEPAWTLEGT